MRVPGATAWSRCSQKPTGVCVAEFQFASKADDIPAGRGKTIVLGEKKIALFHADGAFYAIDGTCLHRGGPLGDGELEGCVVTCPWHGWQFDVRNGEMKMNPAARVNCYQTRVEGSDVQVCC